MKKLRYNAKFVADINVVPYIDVMLVLVVIFMITAPLIYQGVNVNLPQANSRALSVESMEPVIVSVDNEGRYYLNVMSEPDTVMTPNNLALRVAAELKLNPERKIMVKGDKGASYGQVVSAMVVLQQAGVNGVGLITSNPKEA